MDSAILGIIISIGFGTIDLAPVVQRVYSTLHWINLYPLDNSINFDSNYYQLDNDLSSV